MESSECAVIVPAYNEAKTIAAVIEGLKKVGTPIIVDDGSTDETATIARKQGAIVLQHSVNRGYDAALNTGFNEAYKIGFKYFITADADGQHALTSLLEIKRFLNAGVNLVAGKRKRKARVAESIYGFYTKLTYGISDPLCGAKGYSLKTFERRGVFDNCGSIGTQLLLWSMKNGTDFEEVDVNIAKRGDESRFGGGLKTNLRILRAMIRVIKSI